MKTWHKITIGLGITFIVLLIAIIIFSKNVLYNSLPEYDGEIESNQINEQVEIFRDSLAIPYILAKTDMDAYFALGYAHAQERLFQMDFIRRAGSGRLSEVFGRKTLPYDKMFKTLGIYKAAELSLSSLDKHTIDVLHAYSNGINKYLEENSGKLPLEFAMLNYSPNKWKPIHSLIVAKMLAWELNISWWTDFSFTHLIQKFGKEKAKEILPNFEQNQNYIISNKLTAADNIALGLVETDKSFRKFMGFEGTHIGSNNWVVDGKHSSSGKPIIANDPHLAFQAPARWYLAVIKAGDKTTAGFTLPGLPAVVIGKNDNISWVVTNVMADDADFYFETLDSSKTNYLLDGKWVKLNTYTDTIFIKDELPVILKIKSTHRGPIISNIHPYNVLYKNKYRKNGTVSVRWTALDKSTELSSFLAINNASNYNQFKEALRTFYAPGQNFVYADKFGNIAYICGARLPIRETVAPSLVYDGTTSVSDWKGFVSYENMPKLYNPSNGFIATANNKVVQNFPQHISNLWEPDSRINRITELLSKKAIHTTSDFMNYQNDYYSDYASKLTPIILDAFKNASIKEKNLKLALKLLKRWDFTFSAESQTPTIYTRFLQKLIYNTFADEMGKTYLQEYSFIANIPYRVIMQLLKQESSEWFDNVKTGKFETKNDIIRKSLVDALTELEKENSRDLYLWQWGDFHTVTFKHTFSGVNSLLDKIINIGPFPIGGDGTTVNNGEYSFNKPYANNLGPSMRYIYDFNDPENFTCILPTGQSGHFLSNHYKDMTEKWLKGKYIKVNTNIEKNIELYKNRLTILKNNSKN